MRKLRLAVLISGGGTTLQNLIEKIEAGSLQAEIALVVSSAADAYGLERARKHSIPTAVVEWKQIRDVGEFSDRISAHLDEAGPDLVIMGGFLRLYRIPDRYEGRVMNIHPALIPAFCGKGWYGHRVHAAVLEHGAKVSGCTVHFADKRYDHGPIIVQRVVPVMEDDTPDSLAARVFEEECKAYPEAIGLFGEGRLRIEGRRVRVLPRAGEGAGEA